MERAGKEYMEYTENNRELDDMEQELDADKPWSERSKQLLGEIADFLISDEQAQNKGELLKSFKAEKKIKRHQMFIDIYEHAIVGMFEFAQEKELKKLEVGTAYYKIAHEMAGSVYITLYDDNICRLRYMKEGKKIAYLLNKIKGMEKNEKMG